MTTPWIREQLVLDILLDGDVLQVGDEVMVNPAAREYDSVGSPSCLEPDVAYRLVVIRPLGFGRSVVASAFKNGPGYYLHRNHIVAWRRP